MSRPAFFYLGKILNFDKWIVHDQIWFESVSGAKTIYLSIVHSQCNAMQSDGGDKVNGKSSSLNGFESSFPVRRAMGFAWSKKKDPILIDVYKRKAGNNVIRRPRLSSQLDRGTNPLILFTWNLYFGCCLAFRVRRVSGRIWLNMLLHPDIFHFLWL